MGPLGRLPTALTIVVWGSLLVGLFEVGHTQSRGVIIERGHDGVATQVIEGLVIESAELASKGLG